MRWDQGQNSNLRSGCDYTSRQWVGVVGIPLAVGWRCGHSSGFETFPDEPRNSGKSLLSFSIIEQNDSNDNKPVLEINDVNNHIGAAQTESLYTFRKWET